MAKAEPVENLFLKQVLCGAGAGAFTKTITAPLERIKILYQLQGMKTEGIGKNRKYKNLHYDKFCSFYCVPAYKPTNLARRWGDEILYKNPSV